METYHGSLMRKKRICERVRELRIRRFGQGHGAQMAMAKELGLPYTTYRGYEKNRINGEFLIMFSRRMGVSLPWLLGAEEGMPDQAFANNIVLSSSGQPIMLGGYEVLTVQDESMEPSILRNSLVGYLPIKDIREGRLYVVEIKKKVMVRKILKNGDRLIALAENLKIEPNTISPSQILGEVKWNFTRY